MKRILFFISLLIFIGCAQAESKDTNKIYSIDDIAVVGIKMKGDFKTDFPESTDDPTP